MIIDDEPIIAEGLSKIIPWSQWNAEVVAVAPDGLTGQTLIREKKPDLIISDIMMPVMDGIEFCRCVKNKLELSHIPVILLTAKNKEEDRAEAYEVGADAFISKPFNLAVLHARIRNLLKYKERKAHDFKNQLVFEIKELDYTWAMRQVGGIKKSPPSSCSVPLTA